MPLTIQQALRPLLITRFIMGLGVYPVKVSKSNIQLIILSILYSLAVWFAYGYLYYYIVTLFTCQVLFPSVIAVIVACINIFTTIISVIMGLYHQKRFEMCVNNLATVDNTLEELGTPKEYRKMHTWSKLMIIGWIVCSLSLNFFDTLWWLRKEETGYWGLILPYILNCFLHVNAFVDLLFIFFLWYIATRFDKVCEHMRCLLVKEERGLRCTWKKPVIALHRYTSYTNNYKRTLWTSMHLYLELCRVARKLNLMFGTQMTFEIASSLLCLTVLSHILCLILIEDKHQGRLPIQLCCRILWVSIFSVRISIVNCICENVRIKANEVNEIVHQLTNTVRYADVWKELHQFTLQRLHHPLQFTGMGLVFFGNVLLRKFFTTTVAFVIILLQFKTR